MNTNIGQEFEKSYQSFKSRQSTLPERIRFKLNYISSIVLEQKCINPEKLSEEDQLEVSDLKDVNNKGLMVIFNSIVQTLFNEDISIDRQCLIRNKGFFKSWKDGFLKYDDRYIYINASNRTSRYRFKNVDLKLSNNSKRSFNMYYKGTYLLTIKFEKPESMHAMYKTIKSQIANEKIRSESKKKEKAQDQKLHTPRKSSRPKNIREPKSEIKPSEHLNSAKMAKFASSVERREQLKFEKSTLEKEEDRFVERVSREITSNTKSQQEDLSLTLLPPEFEPRHSSKNKFIAIHKTEPRLLLEIIFEVKDSSFPRVNQAMSCLAQTKQWNSNTVLEEINYHMKSQQKVIMYRVYEKGNGFLSSSRQTYTILEFKKINDNMAILVEESLENQDKKESYTRSYLKTVTSIQIGHKSWKVSLESYYDPKGYCSKSEQKQLLYQMYKDLLHFENFLDEYRIKRNLDQPLFSDMKSDEIMTQLSEEQIPEEIVLRASKSMEFIDEDKSSDEEGREDRTLQLYRKSSRKQPFFYLRPLTFNQMPTHEYLELVKRSQHERYYISHKFQMEAKEQYDQTAPDYELKEMLKRGGEYQITENKELVFVNETLIQSQKDTIKFVIKQIGANLISGKSVLNVSLPVDIFDSRTLLERNAAAMGKSPDFFMRCHSADPLTQIKNITAFIASLPVLEVKMQKPFNPILGETLQVYLRGIPLYYEQISHHPPISSYYMKCDEYTLYGNLVAFADVGLNSGVGGNSGVLHVQFKNGSHFQCYFPPNEISGLIYGQRKFRSYGKGFIIERKHKLFSEFSVEKQKKGLYQSDKKLFPGSIVGGIFEYNAKFEDYFNSFQMNLKKFPGLSKQHVEKKLTQISGVWFEKIYMDKENLLEGIKSYPLEYMPCCLPSDSNFRPDVLYHRQNNLSESQREKEVLEKLQRDDRKLREEFSKYK